MEHTNPAHGFDAALCATDALMHRSVFAHFFKRRARTVATFVFFGAVFLSVAPAFASVTAPNIGEETVFFVDPAYDIKNRSQVRAFHQFTGTHAYIYIDAAYLNGLAQEEGSAFLAKAQELLTEFDERIYPIATQTFGTPWEPGIDDDLRVTIFITQLTETAAGYFNPRDEFERSVAPESNEREMLYLNTRFIAGGRAGGFVAHEFQHLISFHWKDKVLGVSDDIWLNEVRSEYVPTLLGYDAIYSGSNLEHRVITFSKNPTDSLTEWRNSPYDYGSVALFAQYLADQYSANIFREMMRSPYVGFASIEDALRSLGKPMSFAEVFANWTVANYLNDISINPRYGYLNSRLRSFRLPMADIVSATGEITFITKDWANNGYRLFGAAQGTLTASLSGNQNPSSTLGMNVVRLENGNTTVRSSMGVNGSLLIQEAYSPHATYLFLPFSKVSAGYFKESEPPRLLTLRVSISPNTQPVEDVAPLTLIPSYPEGSLIRARGDYKVYITKGLFRRHIVSADIFKFYGHLGFASVIEVTPEELAHYKLSAWVRADGDPRVWEINGDGTKHWINIPGEQFAPSGRDWNGVYIINARERDWYVRGADVMK